MFADNWLHRPTLLHSFSQRKSSECLERRKDVLTQKQKLLILADGIQWPVRAKNEELLELIFFSRKWEWSPIWSLSLKLEAWNISRSRGLSVLRYNKQLLYNYHQLQLKESSKWCSGICRGGGSAGRRGGNDSVIRWLRSMRFHWAFCV